MLVHVSYRQFVFDSPQGLVCASLEGIRIHQVEKYDFHEYLEKQSIYSVLR